MTKLCSLLLLSSLISISHAGEKNLSQCFEFCQDIDASLPTGHPGRIKLAGNVFDQSQSFPSDLRIVDSGGRQWPFFLHIPKDETRSSPLSPELLNQIFVAGDIPYWQFELMIPEKDGESPIHNQLELVTSGSDYVRRVELFTVGEESGNIATGYLIHFTGSNQAANQIIRYSQSDALRLKVRVYANAKNSDERFTVKRVTLYSRSVSLAERDPVPFIRLDVPDDETEKNAQTVLLDTGFRNRPVEMITFDCENHSYTRMVSVLGRNAENDPWHRIGGGEVHRLENDSSTSVKLQAASRFLKIHIYHYDDTPLNISSLTVEARPRFLVFEAASKDPAMLYFRAWEMPAPRYDLKKRISAKNIPDIPLFATLETRPNTGLKASTIQKYGKLLAAIAVGAVSLLVIGIIVSMLKHTTLSE